MATTTNYSWTTPDDTALVKDGAAAIRSLGTAIDTTVFTNAGAAIAKATVDAKGDLIAGTADNTVARLAVGANDTILVADSSTATGLKWAAPAAGGGMTLLQSLSLSGASTTSSSLSSSYKQFYVFITGLYGSTQDALNFRMNGDTGSNYAYRAGLFGAGYSSVANISTTSIRITTMSGQSAVKQNSYASLYITRPSDTSEVFVDCTSYMSDGSTADINLTTGVYDSSAAITTLTFLPSSATMTAGTAHIYGVN